MSDSDRLAHIDALVMDVDGVLTDGTFTWSASGEESKSFSFEDVMVLARAGRAGIELGRTYSRPVVSHARAREEALAAFARIKAGE